MSIGICEYEIRLKIAELLHGRDSPLQFAESLLVAKHVLVHVHQEKRARISIGIVGGSKAWNPCTVLKAAHDRTLGLRVGSNFVEQAHDGFRSSRIAAPAGNDCQTGKYRTIGCHTRGGAGADGVGSCLKSVIGRQNQNASDQISAL